MSQEQATMQVRPFTEPDRSGVMALAGRLGEGVAQWRDPASVRQAVRGWVDASLGGSATVFVAVEPTDAAGPDGDEDDPGERVVGFVSMSTRQHFTGVVDAYIGELVVDAAASGRGIGRALVDAAEAEARRRGHTRITLDTGAANRGARAFYHRLGYAEEDVRLSRDLAQPRSEPRRAAPSADPTADAVARLTGLLRPGAVVTDPDVVEGYRHDRSGLGHGVVPGMPLAVVRASSTADVQAVIRACAASGVPVVPRGAGSGLTAGATAVDGCIVLSLERMRSISVEPAAMLAVVQPGALNSEVKAAAAQHSLFYPPDPSSDFSSIGGNLATNAGGLCCVKYGVTTDYVLGLEVVLADGTAVRLGGRTVKDVAGFDLKRLFVGSEGTLGVITEAVLRLRAAPPAATTLVASFPSLVAAGVAVSAIVTRLRPSLLEIMDRASLAAVDRYRPMGLDLDAAALLLARTDSGGERGRAEVAAMAAACAEAGATLVEQTDDPAEGEMYLGIRRMVYPAFEASGHALLIEDVAVPLPQIAAMLADVEAVAASHDTVVATVGHAGDGNLHPLIVFDDHDPAATERAGRTFDAIISAALARGGTISGEHGIGLLKRRQLGEQLGEDVLRLHRAIKAALDPYDILNPGKVV